VGDMGSARTLDKHCRQDQPYQVRFDASQILHWQQEDQEDQSEDGKSLGAARLRG
jgi:hypothetical protein